MVCWGDNASGQIGDGTTTDRGTPVTIPPPGGMTWAQIAAGDNHTCARTNTGRIYCWGRNLAGELGIGMGLTATTPQAVGAATNWVDVAAGAGHTCALNS